MQIQYQTTVQQDADLQAKALRETTAVRIVTPNSLLEQVISDYCARVAAENQTTNKSKIAAWVALLTDAQEAEFIRRQTAIDILVGNK